MSSRNNPLRAYVHELIFIAILLVGAVVRYRLVISAHPFYNADTAIVDLMARHFMKGEWTFYYWGELYYGVLDPVLLMPLFKMFGQTIAISGLLPFTASLIFLALFHLFVRRECGFWIAHAATFLMAVPSTIYLQYSLTTYNYSFAPCFGMGLLLLGRDLKDTRHLARWFYFGLLLGFSYYYFRLSLMFFLAYLIREGMLYLAAHASALRERIRTLSGASFWKERVLLKGQPLPAALRRIVAIVNVVVVILGTLCVVLWFHGNVEHVLGPGKVLKISFWHTLEATYRLAFAGVAIVYWRFWVQLVRQAWGRAYLRRLGAGFLIGASPVFLGYFFGVFPRSPGKIVSLPVAVANLRLFIREIVPLMLQGYPAGFFHRVAVVLFYIGVVFVLARSALFFLNCIRGKPDSIPTLVLVGMMGFVLGMVGVDLFDFSSGRYFLPFLIALPLSQILCLSVITRRACLPAGRARWLMVPLVGVLWATNAAAVWPMIQSPVPGDRFEAVSKQLIEDGYKAGYADYWIAYYLTAVSQEKIVVAATADNDRYPPYLQAARTQEKTFLLSYTPVPINGPLEIKGVKYRLLGQRTLNSFLIYDLQKLP